MSAPQRPLSERELLVLVSTRLARMEQELRRQAQVQAVLGMLWIGGLLWALVVLS